MEAFGAEVVLVDQSPGSVPGQVSRVDLELVEERARSVVAEHQAFCVDQFVREANSRAHERTRGPEIWEQSGETVEVFLDLVDTCGTFTGIARALRARNPRLRTYLVEPAGAAVLASRHVTEPRRKLQGAGYGRTNLALFDPSLMTGYLQATDSEAVEAARYLAAQEGVLAGFSTRANLVAAWQLLTDKEAGATIAFLACDSGLKDLSTELYP